MTDKDQNPLDVFYSEDKDVDTAGLYDAWAVRYEQDLRDVGYAAPMRCAEALAAADPSLTGPVADLGCGSGLSGEALAAVGFTEIDGYDFSEGMLALARAKNCYRDIVFADLSQEGVVPDRGYRHATLIGVLHPSHAPPQALSGALALLSAGGCVVFTINDETLNHPEYEKYVDGLVTSEAIEIVSRDYGPHLPARGVGAKVYVVRKR